MLAVVPSVYFKQDASGKKKKNKIKKERKRKQEKKEERKNEVVQPLKQRTIGQRLLDSIEDTSIKKTCLYNFDPLKPHFYIVKLGFTGVYIIFLISAQNIDCGYSLEPPRRGGSNEYP